MESIEELLEEANRLARKLFILKIIDDNPQVFFAKEQLIKYFEENNWE